MLFSKTFGDKHARHHNASTPNKRRAKRRLASRRGIEALEDRRLLTISWSNHGAPGSDTDSFQAVYGALAATARADVDQAIAYWNAAVPDAAALSVSISAQ